MSANITPPEYLEKKTDQNKWLMLTHAQEASIIKESYGLNFPFLADNVDDSNRNYEIMVNTTSITH